MKSYLPLAAGVLATLTYCPTATAQDGGYSPPAEDNSGYQPPASNGGGASGQSGYQGSARSRRGGGGGGGTPEILQPSSRPMYFVGGLGPDFHGLNLGKDVFRGKNPARFALTLDFGYHFDGAGEGPVVGATLEQTFGKGFYTLNPAGKFLWDIMIADMAIYVAPFGKLGYLLGTSSGSTAHGLDLGFGVEGRVVLQDRWMLFFRPLQIDIILGDFFGETAHVNALLVLGGGVTF